MTLPFELLLVQHAEKEPAQGDPGLTDRGRRQAATTAEFLAGSSWDALYCSPLRRARETASPIEAACGLEVQVDDRLRERMNWGDNPVQSRAEFLDDWQRATLHRSWKPSSGDSSTVTAARMLRAITEFAANNHDRVLVVGHGGATVDLLRTLIGDDDLTALAPGVIRDGVPGCALTRLTFDGSWRAEKIGDPSHLLDR